MENKMTENMKMNTATKIKRFLVVAAIFCALVSYLYLFQGKYEEWHDNKVHPIARAVFFAIVLLGASSIIDICKHIYRLSQQQFDAFYKSLAKAIGCFVLYIIVGTAFHSLTNGFIAPPTPATDALGAIAFSLAMLTSFFLQRSVAATIEK